MQQTEKLTLDNICGGAVPEVFQRGLAIILQNIRDPNTSPEEKRKLTLEFTFKPHSTRSGADITLKMTPTRLSLEPVTGVMYVSGKRDNLSAYPHDPRQDVLFDQPSNKQTQ
jgi:hypothetical protein